jgi:hypothetical protein
MAVNLQPTYTGTQPIGLPGQPATEHGWDGDSFIVDKAATVRIPFGVACSLKVASDPLSVIIGGTAALFRGVSYRDITQPPRSPEGYAAGENISLMVRGDIWVRPISAIAAGDPVKFDVNGLFGSAGLNIVANAQWMRGGAANGLALLRIHSVVA